MTWPAPTRAAIGLAIVAVGSIAVWIAAGLLEFATVGLAAAALLVVAGTLVGHDPPAFRLDPLPATTRRGDTLLLSGQVLERDPAKPSPARRFSSWARSQTDVVELTVGDDRYEVPSSGARAEQWITARTRGTLTVGPLRGTRRDPFGLLRWSWADDGVAEILVLPRTVPLPSATGTAMDRSLLREFADGDDARWVHPLTSARAGSLMVRPPDRLATGACVVTLDLDASRYTSDDDFEEAVEITASICAAGYDHGEPPELILGERPVPGSLDAILRELARVEPLESSSSAWPARGRGPGPGQTHLLITGAAATPMTPPAPDALTISVGTRPGDPATPHRVLRVGRADELAQRWSGVNPWGTRP